MGDEKSQLVVTLTNSPQSLDLLRNNLKDPTASADGTANNPLAEHHRFLPEPVGAFVALGEVQVLSRHGSSSTPAPTPPDAVQSQPSS